MSEYRQIKNLRLRPLSTRVRARLPGPTDAIETGYDRWDPIELYLSPYGEDYITGRIKQVGNYLDTKNSTIFSSFSLVWVQERDQASYAARHKAVLLEDLAAEYKNTVARFAAEAQGKNPKGLKRLRARMNLALGSSAPEPDKVDAYLKDHPKAIEEGAEIRALWEEVKAR